MSEKPAPAVCTIKVFSAGMIANFGVCESNIHVFREVPGRCECGREYWDDEPAKPNLRLV